MGQSQGVSSQPSVAAMFDQPMLGTSDSGQGDASSGAATPPEPPALQHGVVMAFASQLVKNAIFQPLWGDNRDEWTGGGEVGQSTANLGASLAALYGGGRLLNIAKDGLVDGGRLAGHVPETPARIAAGVGIVYCAGVVVSSAANQFLSRGADPSTPGGGVPDGGSGSEEPGKTDDGGSQAGETGSGGGPQSSGDAADGSGDAAGSGTDSGSGESSGSGDGSVDEGGSSSGDGTVSEDGSDAGEASAETTTETGGQVTDTDIYPTVPGVDDPVGGSVTVDENGQVVPAETPLPTDGDAGSVAATPTSEEVADLIRQYEESIAAGEVPYDPYAFPTPYPAGTEYGYPDPTTVGYPGAQWGSAWAEPTPHCQSFVDAWGAVSCMSPPAQPATTQPATVAAPTVAPPQGGAVPAK